MDSELQAHGQRAQSPEMEMDFILNVLNVLEYDLSAEERVHCDVTASVDYDEPGAFDDTKNAINRRYPMDITSDSINHFIITAHTTIDIKPTISRRNGCTALDNITLFGISISVIVHIL